MSNKDYQTPPESERLAANSLRERIADKVIAEAKQKAEQARAKDEEKRRAYQEFMDRKFTDNDRLRIRAKAESAADHGHMEIEVITFPSEYLEDHGRRINNGDHDWHVSLTGYAKSCYDAFMDLGQPQGFKLIARVLDYPNGMIGNIGLYFSWKE